MALLSIDTDVPVPSEMQCGYSATAAKLLLGAQIGDSVFIPGGSHGAASKFHLHGGAGWYTARSVQGGIRFWKTAEPPRISRRISPPAPAVPTIDADTLARALVIALGKLAARAA